MKNQPEDYCKPTIFRYLGVMLYDTVLLLCVLLFSASIAVGFNALVTGGEAIESGNPFFFMYLMLSSFLFYGWFWTHGGQTLGMRSWKVYLINQSNTHITWRQSLLRFITAIIAWLPAGFGIWYLYLGKDNQSWPDMMSGTKLHYSKHAKNKPLSKLS